MPSDDSNKKEPGIVASSISNGVRLHSAQLLDETGQPNELLNKIIENGEIGELFSEANWMGATREELRAVYNALPGEQQEEIAIHRLSLVRIGDYGIDSDRALRQQESDDRFITGGNFIVNTKFSDRGDKSGIINHETRGRGRCLRSSLLLDKAGKPNASLDRIIAHGAGEELFRLSNWSRTERNGQQTAVSDMLKVYDALSEKQQEKVGSYARERITKLRKEQSNSSEYAPPIHAVKELLARAIQATGYKGRS